MNLLSARLHSARKGPAHLQTSRRTAARLPASLLAAAARPPFVAARGLRLPAFALLLLLSGTRSDSLGDDDTIPIGLPQIARLDLLPRLQPQVQSASISSYDRTGGNDDGFSGKYSFIRKEVVTDGNADNATGGNANSPANSPGVSGKEGGNNGGKEESRQADSDGDAKPGGRQDKKPQDKKRSEALVIADLKGPGVITRIWTPTPTDDIVEFFFDGETRPRLRCTVRQLFDGTHPPFVAPLCGFGSGGFYSYLPLPYKVSCKIRVRAPKVQFYQINYATYTRGAALTTFAPDSPAYGGYEMQKAQATLNMAGSDLSATVVPAHTDLQTTRTAVTLQGGAATTLFETRRPGRIAGLRLSPAGAFAGKNRDLTLRITWDGSDAPAVLCPVGDFFGYSWGEPAARSLLVGSRDGTAYAYFPMPFDKSARIEIVSENPNAAPIPIQAEIVYAPVPRRADEGRFYALWRRENPTTNGKPFQFVQTTGRGQLVGVSLNAQGCVPGITPFFEGDDQATLDGELRIHGTGSEDFFNGGWYDVPGRWEARASYPLSGCLDYSRPQARSGGYRLFLTDAYRFNRSLQLDMEHAPEKNDFVADYVGVSYLYLENPPHEAWTLPPLAARRVVDPSRLVYNPGWYMPIHAFSMENATLSKKLERIAGVENRYLRLSADGDNKFGEHVLSLLCDVPAPGRYRVTVEAMRGPAQGITQLFVNEHAVGPALDLYADRRSRSPFVVMGEQDMKAGPNQVFFKLMGKNPRSSGLALDLVTLALEKLP